jgi:ribosomal protein S18 acetylase RimI-like enzyme
MSTHTLYEIIGYVGSALIVVSLAMSNIIRLRVVNLVGALVFMTYGVLIGSFPVMATNLIISGIDVWYLRRELSTLEELTVVTVRAGDPFFGAFIERYTHDLDRYLDPDHAIEDLHEGGDVRLVMLRNAVPAGVFVGSDVGDGTLEIVLDYVAPAYRDLKHGESLYHDDAERFRDLGYTRLTVPHVDHRRHASFSYFAKMGFTDEGGTAMSRSLTDG